MEQLEYYKTELARSISAKESNSEDHCISKNTASILKGDLFEQIRGVKFSMEQFLDDITPSVYKYFLWCSQNSSGPYSQLQQNEESKVDCATNKMPTNLSLIDQQRMNSTKEKVHEISSNIQMHLKGLMDHKSGIIKEVCRLDRLMQQEVFQKMTPEALDSFIKWIDQVFFYNL